MAAGTSEAATTITATRLPASGLLSTLKDMAPKLSSGASLFRAHFTMKKFFKNSTVEISLPFTFENYCCSCMVSCSFLYQTKNWCVAQ